MEEALVPMLSTILSLTYLFLWGGGQNRKLAPGPIVPSVRHCLYWLIIGELKSPSGFEGPEAMHIASLLV